MKLIYKLISVLGLVLGYTTDVVAQYGVFYHYYPGIVVTKDCNISPEKVKLEVFVKRENEPEYIISSAISDEEGNFFVESRYRSYFSDSNVFLRITPVSNSLLKDTIYPYSFDKATIFEIPYIGVPPCLDTIPVKQDTTQIFTPEESFPVIELDSFIVINEDSTETYQPELPAGNDEMTLYPNPNKGRFAIEFYDDKENDYQIVIYDMTGKQVFIRKIRSRVGKNRVKLNTYFLQPATYALILKSNNRIAYKKYVQQ